MAQAAVVAALRVECAVIRPRRGLYICPYAIEMQALIQCATVEEETFLLRELGWKEMNKYSDFRKGAVLFTYFFKALRTSRVCQLECLGLGQKSDNTTSLAL